MGGWSGSAQATIHGSDTGAYSAASGALITWNTNAVLGGRHLRGKTFLVPISGPSLSTTGQILAAARTGILSSANIFVTATGSGGSGVFKVWSRASGASATVSSAAVGTKVCVLRSRRD